MLESILNILKIVLFGIVEGLQNGFQSAVQDI